MTTVRDSIIAAIMTALAGIDGIDPEAIELEPVGDPDTFPALAIYDSGDEPIEREAGLVRRVMHLTIEGYVQRGDGAEASAERNALHGEAVAAIMFDDTLGGIVELVEAANLRLLTAVLATQRRLAFSQDFDIQFVSQRRNPALPA